jgi:hypothetical protein
MIGSLEALTGLMRQDGAVRIYAKKLAPNDNSKNQVYLGGDFSVLNILPHGEVQTDEVTLAGSVRDRAKAKLRFSWVDSDGIHPAPNAQLILYPKYPEVRLSGFLLRCRQAPAEIMRVRDEGRVLFFGVTNDGRILGYAAAAGSSLALALHARSDLVPAGVFLELPDASGISSRDRLIAALTAIYHKRWIGSQKMGRDGVPHPYNARNGGGYTLEAELGISPNGYSEPDYLGWEVKQYGVGNFIGFAPKTPVTLLTPEPTGGIYQEAGFHEFMRRYGYADKSGVKGRTNFGGVYACNKQAHLDTGLRLRMMGYDEATGKITDLSGGIVLLDRSDQVAALWRFTGIIEHWNRKHAQAAYVPSLFRAPPPAYSYGPRVLLCEGTDLSLFLKAIADGTIYLDPALKLFTTANGGVDWKKRNQFRVRHANLNFVYHKTESIDLPAQGQQMN